jgi:hypothetical protein
VADHLPGAGLAAASATAHGTTSTGIREPVTTASLVDPS